MIKQYPLSFSLDCSKMLIAIRKATKAMRKLGEVNRLRNKQYLRKIRKVPRKQKKAYLKKHSREIFHLRRLKGDFCKANYKHRHWLYNRPELFNRHIDTIRKRILNCKWMDYNQKSKALAYIPDWFEILGRYVHQRNLNRLYLSTWQMNSSTFEPLPPNHPGEENIEHVCNPIGE